MNRRTELVCAAAAAVVAASLSPSASGANLWWQGGSGGLASANYYNEAASTSGNTPAADDVVNFGKTGIGTYSGGTELSIGKLRVGYNTEPTTTGPNAPYIGDGTVTVTGLGTKVSLIADTGTGVSNADLWVGNVRNGTLNIEDGANVTSARLAVIGVGSNVSRTGTLNVKTGGSLTVTAGNMSLGDVTATGNGVQGHVTLADDNSNITLTAGALLIGNRAATSTFTQTGGTFSSSGAAEVGVNGSTVANAALKISGGSFTTGGNIFVGRGASTGSTMELSGTGDVNVTGRFLMGGQTAVGILMNHSGGTLTTTQDVRVGDAGTGDATYNLSNTGVINSTSGGHVGRQGTGIFNQTGGDANFNGTLNIGNREAAAGANSGLYKISDGDLTIIAAGTALSIAANGVGQFRVVGDDSTIDVNGNFVASTGANGNSTLAFELEAGDAGLSLIDVAGTATFASGASLVLDDSAAAPTQTVYDLLTATTITDNGIAFSGPAGWSYQIVPGGNGEILQVVVPEPASFGLIALTGFLALRRRRA